MPVYFVYFDRYRHPRKAIPEVELREKYENDPDAFLKAMEGPDGRDGSRGGLGHVGILRFENEGEVKEFLETTGEEVIGFFEGRAESRPYNF